MLFTMKSLDNLLLRFNRIILYLSYSRFLEVLLETPLMLAYLVLTKGHFSNTIIIVNQDSITPD